MEERVQQLEQLLSEAKDLLDEAYQEHQRILELVQTLIETREALEAASQHDEFPLAAYKKWHDRVWVAVHKDKLPSSPFVLTTEGAKILRGETESS